MDTYAFSDRESSVSERCDGHTGDRNLSGLTDAAACIDWDGGTENGDGALETVATRANTACFPGPEE